MYSIQGNEKSGGFVNRLVVTCLRSGHNRTFRVLQKPERAPIRALRVSSSGRLYTSIDMYFTSHKYRSGSFYKYKKSALLQEVLLIQIIDVFCRYLLILLRDAPVEVWAMTKTPIMVK